jgi:23S rRNA (cytosine1962-C5)-methyltransferase
MSGMCTPIPNCGYDTRMHADSATLPVIRLKIERRTSHPWVFQKMVEKPTAKVPNGAVVDVLDRDGKWVGRGLYNAHSRISLRILTTDANEPIDGGWFARKIGRAVELRRNLLKLDDVTDAYRVVPSDADGLSGSLRPTHCAGVLFRRHVSPA